MPSRRSRKDAVTRGVVTAVVITALVVANAGCDRDRRPRAVPISVGQTVTGRLEPGDWTDVFADGSYTDLYEIQLAAGQRITVELRSSDFDTYLSLMRGPGDQLVDNDDIVLHVNKNSRVTYQAQVSRGYFVAATTYDAGATGSYTLTVTDASQPSRPAPDASQPSRPAPDVSQPSRPAPDVSQPSRPAPDADENR